MKTRTRKILRDLWSRKIRTALVSASIFVGVFGVVTLFSTGEILVGQLEKDLQEDRLAMVRLNTEVRSGVEVDNDAILAALQQKPDSEFIQTSLPPTVNADGTTEPALSIEEIEALGWTTHVEARVVYPFFWRKSGDEDFEDAYIITHSEPFAQSYLEPARLFEGNWPGEGQCAMPDGMTAAPLQVAVERRLAESFDIGICDTLEIRRTVSSQPTTILGATPATDVPVVFTDNTAAPATPQNTEFEVLTVQVVGLMFQPYGYRTITGNTSPDQLLFADYADAQALAGFTGFTSFYARFETYAAAEKLEPAFQRAVSNVEYGADQVSPYRVNFSQIEDPAENATIDGVRAQNTLLITLAFAALIVSGFLVVNVISAIISEQRRQIGAMKALGATTLDTLYMYTGIATMYGVIGAVPGVLLGIPAGYFAAQGLAAQSQTIIEAFSVSPTGIILGFVVGIAVPFFASLFPVIMGTRVSIREAMTDAGISANYGRGLFGFLDRAIGNLPMPSWLRQAMNNAFQKKGRLALSGLTLTVANGAFMGIFAVFFALTSLVDTAFQTFGYQIQVRLVEGQDYETVRDTIESDVDGLVAVEPGITLAIQIADYTPPPITAGPPGIFAYGFNPSNRDVFVLDENTMVDPQSNPFPADPDEISEGVVVADRITESMGLEVGDTITVVTSKSEPRAFEIIGIVDYDFDGIWFDWRTLADYAGFVDGNGRPYTNTLNVIMDTNDPTADDVDNKIEEIENALLTRNITADSQNQVALQELILRIVIILGVVLSLGAFLIAAVGGIGLLIMLSISVFERQREIGVMRSVGATSWTVASQFLIEGLLVGSIAWLLAIPLSFGLRAVLLVGLPFGDDFDIPYPPITLVVGFVGMLFLVFLSSILPSLAASRRTVSDILRYQ